MRRPSTVGSFETRRYFPRRPRTVGRLETRRYFRKQHVSFVVVRSRDCLCSFRKSATAWKLETIENFGTSYDNWTSLAGCRPSARMAFVAMYFSDESKSWTDKHQCTVLAAQSYCTFGTIPPRAGSPVKCAAIGNAGLRLHV